MDAPISEISTPELIDQITELAGHLNAANARWLALIAEFDRRRGWAEWGVRSCAHWLNWKCGIALGAAREKLRTAHALVGLPRIAGAMAQGRLSFSKVREPGAFTRGGAAAQSIAVMVPRDGWLALDQGAAAGRDRRALLEGAPGGRGLDPQKRRFRGNAGQKRLTLVLSAGADHAPLVVLTREAQVEAMDFAGEVPVRVGVRLAAEHADRDRDAREFVAFELDRVDAGDEPDGRMSDQIAMEIIPQVGGAASLRVGVIVGDKSAERR
jgi:hypothetical protein